MSAVIQDRLVLVGPESSGKSSLFRGLTGRATGDEANFRGSTVVCRRCRSADCDCEVVDTPGLRDGGADAVRLALDEMNAADRVLLVVRGTDLTEELSALLRELPLDGKRAAVAVTFADKSPPEVARMVARYREALNLPVVMLNARDLGPGHRNELLEAIRSSRPGRRDVTLPAVPEVTPAALWFERKLAGPLLSLMLILAMYGLPVWAAYLISGWLQPIADAAFIEPMVGLSAGLPSWLQSLATGGYGVFTLGWYSLLWAFPVVLFIGISTAIAEESGLHDRVTRALDPWLRKIGLDGRDLMPVLSGYGCNVVAVMQSRACSACSRKACVSMVSFGSACSYQIGATLAVFSAAGRPGCFLPYRLALFVAGAAHTRIWHGRRKSAPVPRPAERSFLQVPRWRAVGWRVRALVKSFLLQSMPIFLGICLLAAAMEMAGLLGCFASAVRPLMNLLGLPGETATALVLSILRKDDILLLVNESEGLLESAGPLPLFLLVRLAP